MRRFHIVDGVKRTRVGDALWPNRAEDLRPLEDLIEDVGAKLCIIDPISAYMAHCDTHKDADTRSVLGPLAALAQRTGCAIVASKHLNKATSSRAVYGVTGSVAFVNAARMAWIVGRDPDDDTRRIMAPFKCNVIESPQAFSFAIVDGRIEWGGLSELTADQLLVAADEDRTKLNEAVDFLVTILASGLLPVNEIKHAADEVCTSWSTIKRAKKSLPVRSSRDGFGKGGKSAWSLPMEEHAP